MTNQGLLLLLVLLAPLLLTVSVAGNVLGGWLGDIVAAEIPVVGWGIYLVKQ